MLAAGHSVLPLSFRSFFILFFAALSPRSIGRSSLNFATYLMVTQIYKIQSEIWVAPSLWNLAAQKHQNFARFCRTSQLDHEYLRNRHSHMGKLNSVYFGPQMVKNRIDVLTQPTGSHQAGLCHASSSCSSQLFKAIKCLSCYCIAK